MHNKLGRKVLYGVVMFSMVLSLAPVFSGVQVAQAATPVACSSIQPGDFIKVEGKPAILGIDASGLSRYWAEGAHALSRFSTYKAMNYKYVTQECVNSLKTPVPAPHLIPAAPGSEVFKYDEFDQWYVRLPGAMAPVSQAVAKALYGSNVVPRKISLRDWPHFAVCKKDEYKETIPHAGQVIKVGNTMYWVGYNKEVYEITANGMTANNLLAKFVRTWPESVLSNYTKKDKVDSYNAMIGDVHQQGWDCNVNPTMGTWTKPTPGPIVTPTSTAVGDLTLSLAADTPPQVEGVPKSATNVDVLKFNVTNNGREQLVLDELTVTRKATAQIAGDATGLTLYLYEGDTRVGDGRSVSSDSNEASFNSLNFAVNPGQTKVLTVRMRTGSTVTTGWHQFGVVSGKLTSSGKVLGTPVVGNKFQVNSSQSAGSVTIAGSGTLDTPSIGQTNAGVAQFKLTAASENIKVQSLTLRQDGTLDTSLLSNFKLYEAGKEVPSTVSVNGRLVTVSLNPVVEILDGANKIFTLRADISAQAEGGRTIVFFMNNDNDIKAVGHKTGFGVSVTRSSFDEAASGEGQTLTLKGGNIIIANKSMVAHDIKTDSTEVELGRLAITSRADTVTIEKLTAQLATTPAYSSPAAYGTYKDADQDGAYDSGETLLIRNIKVKDADTGAVLGSAKAITDAAGPNAWAASNAASTTLSFQWTDSFDVKKGTTRNLSLVADINSAQISGVVYTATFRMGNPSYFTIKDSRGTTVSSTEITPYTDVASYAVTTRSSGLTISRASTPESRTVVKGTTVDALGMIMTAGTGQGNDVKVTGLTLVTYIDDDTDDTYGFATNTTGTVAARDLVESVELWDDAGNKLSDAASPDGSGLVVFDSLKLNGGFTINAGNSKKVIVRAKVSGNAPYGGDDRFAFTFTASRVTAYDPAGSSITPTISDGDDINDTTGPKKIITVTSAGTITTSADPSKPTARILLAGSAAEQEIHRVKFDVTKEPFRVEKLTVGVSESGSYDGVGYLALYNASGTLLSDKVGLDSNGEAVFNNLNFQVDRAGLSVIVKAKMNAIGERTVATSSVTGTDADSGDRVTVDLSTTANEFRAVGVYSGTVDTAANSGASNTHSVRKSKPVVTLLTQSTGDAKLSNGTKTLLKFSVTADSSGDISLAQISPYIQFTDSDSGDELALSGNSFNLYDESAPGVNLLAIVPALDTSSTAYHTLLLATSTAPVIGAGQTKTFVFRANVTGAETNDNINVRMGRDTAGEFTNDNYFTNYTKTVSDVAGWTGGAYDSRNRFVWSDRSADSHGYSSIEWANSYFLSNGEVSDTDSWNLAF